MSELFNDSNILYENRKARETQGHGDLLFLIDGEYRIYTASRVTDETGAKKTTFDADGFRVLTAEEAKQYCHERVAPNGTYCSLRALKNCEKLGIFEEQNDESVRHAEEYCEGNNDGHVTPLVMGYENRWGWRPPAKQSTK